MTPRGYVVLFSLLLFVGCSSTSKTGLTKEPLGQASGVVLATEESADSTFSRLVHYLRDSGFNLPDVNAFSHHLRTDFKPMDNESYTYRIDAVIPSRDSTIVVFRGQVLGPHIQIPAQIERNSGNFSNIVWSHFHDMVTGFPHKEVYYSYD